LIDTYFSLTDIDEKQKVKANINAKIHEHIDFNLELQELQLQRFINEAGKYENLKPKSKKKVDKWQNELDNLKSKRQNLHALQNEEEKPYFLWHLFFADVFKDGGFDIVIANPPYVSHDKIETILKNLIKSKFESFEAFADIYCYFLELGIILLKDNGLSCNITSNSYLKAEYGKPLRNYLTEKSDILQIINVEDYQLFDTAIVNTAIIITQKDKRGEKKCKIVNEKYKNNISFLDFIDESKHYYLQSDLLTDSWTLALRKKLQLILKVDNHGIPLDKLNTKIRLGIATGANYAFIIDENSREDLLKLDSSNNNIIKPILRGRDIDRYGYSNPSKYIILTKNGVKVKTDYPTIYNYFLKFGDDFKNRGAKGQHWTNLRACAFFDDFKLEKIIWIELTDKGRFALCNEEIYLVNSAYFLLPPNNYSSKYLLAVLNSRIIQFYLSVIAGTSGMGTLRWINTYVQNIPIPNLSKELQEPFIDLVSQILTAKKANPQADTTALEAEIDELVYELYGLTEGEIKIVEESV